MTDFITNLLQTLAAKSNLNNSDSLGKSCKYAVSNQVDSLPRL